MPATHSSLLSLSTRILLLTAATLAMTACAIVSGFPKSSQNDDTELTASALYFAADVRAKEDANDDGQRGGLTRQQYRDAVVYGRLNAIDIRYFQFSKALSGTNNGFSTSADLGVLLLNGVGATTGASATKAALAAASAGVVGAKATVNTDLFYQKTLPALIAQMEAGRQTQLVIIKTGLGKTVDLYPLGEALNDVQNYYVAGTLPSAVQQVTTAAGASNAKATGQLQSISRDSAFIAAAGSQESLIDRVQKLTSAQALTVLTLMRPKLTERGADIQQNINAIYPGFGTIKDGPTALKALNTWISMDGRTAAFQAEWKTVLDAVAPVAPAAPAAPVA